MRPVVFVLVAAALIAGCGDRSSVEAGGRAPGDIVTIYVFLPREGPQAKMTASVIRGAKLALAEAGGRAGEVTVQFATKAEPVGEDAIADAVEEIVRDTGTIAVIGDLEPATARVTAPLLNAVGMLHVSPGPPAVGAAQPAAQRTYFALDLLRDTAPPPPGFAAAFDGLRPTAAAGAGYAAMNAVLAALRDAGPRAPVRSEVIRAFTARR